MKQLLLLILAFSMNGYAQNTLSYEAGGSSPEATLADISWISGHWRGEAFGGITEEIWSPPLGDSMMFSFKLVVDGKVSFYELGHIQEIDGTLLLQLKHFDGDLKAWEEKTETEDFKLVKYDNTHVYFDDFTFEKISANEINLYVVLGQADGGKEEVKFNYKKY
tara:strand:- start:5662 stop:6153 length:492 start_codon:yes stop_codon:yes gene_type:complete